MGYKTSKKITIINAICTLGKHHNQCNKLSICKMYIVVAKLAEEHTVRKTKKHRLFHSSWNKIHRSEDRPPFITSRSQTHPRLFYVALHMISPTHAVTCRVELYDSVLIFQSAICLIILFVAALTGRIRPFMTEKPKQTINKEPTNPSQLRAGCI